MIRLLSIPWRHHPLFLESGNRRFTADSKGLGVAGVDTEQELDCLSEGLVCVGSEAQNNEYAFAVLEHSVVYVYPDVSHLPYATLEDFFL